MIDTTGFDLDLMLNNLTAAFTNVRQLILAISFVCGVTLLVRGVMMYRIFANQTFGSAQRGELAGPLVHMVIGAILMYYPSTVKTTLTTIFGTNTITPADEILAYESVQDSEKWARISSVVVMYLQLIGYIAFIRGWIILSKMGHSGAQPGSIGKGLIHVIGGILLVNVVATFQILATTFGYAGA